MDPSQGTSLLEKALRTKEGWQVCMCVRSIAQGFWTKTFG